jgi:hypothetical protein
MILRALAAATLVALDCVAAESTPVTDLAFKEAPACRVNEIPLGQPARIEAQRTGAQLEVKVAANFGCSTNAGKARVETAGSEIRLYAETILPGFPTPACKCTRHLEYRFTSAEAASRIVFYKDGRPEGEATIAPQ